MIIFLLYSVPFSVLGCACNSLAVVVMMEKGTFDEVGVVCISFAVLFVVGLIGLFTGLQSPDEVKLAADSGTDGV